VLAVAAGVLSVTVGESAVATGAGSATAGVLAVAAETVAEIIFTPVTTTLSEDPELVSAFAFCPMTSTSWPTCAFRSTVLLVIVKV
jgi:hypothetical protein